MTVKHVEQHYGRRNSNDFQQELDIKKLGLVMYMTFKFSWQNELLANNRPVVWIIELLGSPSHL